MVMGGRKKQYVKPSFCNTIVPTNIYGLRPFRIRSRAAIYISHCILQKSESPSIEKLFWSVVTYSGLFLVFCCTGAYPASVIPLSTVKGSSSEKNKHSIRVLKTKFYYGLIIARATNI